MEDTNRWKRPAERVWVYVSLLCVAILLAHTVAFFAHEYSHSFVAWILGFKANPLAINYGHWDLANILFQQEIDEKVNYGPIFASHHDLAAAIIALAGIGIGNAGCYIIGQALFRRQVFKATSVAQFFLFWLLLMSVANVWSYVPIRTVTTHADIAIAARGLHVSVWVFLALAVLPAVAIVGHFFLSILPFAYRTGTLSATRAFRSANIALTCYICFGIFGGAVAIGGNYGTTAAVFAILSAFVVAPAAMVMTLLAEEKGTGSILAAESGARGRYNAW